MLTAKVLYESVVAQYAPPEVVVMDLPPGVAIKYAIDAHTPGGALKLYCVDHRNRTAFPVDAARQYLFDMPSAKFDVVMGSYAQQSILPQVGSTDCKSAHSPPPTDNTQKLLSPTNPPLHSNCGSDRKRRAEPLVNERAAALHRSYRKEAQREFEEVGF